MQTNTPTHTTKVTAATRNRDSRRRELLRRLRAAGPGGIAVADLARELDVTSGTLRLDRIALERAGAQITSVYEVHWHLAARRRRAA
jgi:NADH/NAD ratio-sensing transcriptional regulator Rex